MSGEVDAGIQLDGVPSVTCGNRVRDVGEDCDDGNTTDDGNGCSAQCKKNAVCGDKKVQPLFEACDHGNKADPSCSPDCKLLMLERIPVSYGGGVDLDSNGTFDLFQDNLSGLASVTAGGSIEVRAGFELNARGLGASLLLKSASFAFSKCCLTSQAVVQLHGYVGDGTLSLLDLTRSGLVAAFNVNSTEPSSIDVAPFMRTILRDQSPYVGFVLRTAAKPPTEFSVRIYTPFSEVPAQHPRLLVVYCVDADGNNVCD